jgi:hypothetical protein
MVFYGNSLYQLGEFLKAEVRFVKCMNFWSL